MTSLRFLSATDWREFVEDLSAVEQTLRGDLAACDFGYLAVGPLLQLTQNAFATMQRLERYRGRFYSWYETSTLKFLLSLYVSIADSGNLAGNLLTLGAGLRELADQPILGPQLFPSLRDTVAIVRELDGQNPELEHLDATLACAPATFSAGFALLHRVTDQAMRTAAALLKATQDLEHQVHNRQVRRLQRGKSQLQLSAISSRWTHAQAGRRA